MQEVNGARGLGWWGVEILRTQRFLSGSECSKFVLGSSEHPCTREHGFNVRRVRYIGESSTVSLATMRKS